MTNLVQKSVCANQLVCANRVRYNWAHRAYKENNKECVIAFLDAVLAAVTELGENTDLNGHFSHAQH